MRGLSCCYERVAYAQAVLPRCCVSNSCIRESAEAEIASNRGASLIPRGAYAHTVLVRFWLAKSPILLMEAAAIDARNGLSLKQQRAHAQAVLARLYGSNALIKGCATLPIGAIRGSQVFNRRRANAQQVFDKF